MRRLLGNFWKQQQVVARQQGFHGPPFSSGRGDIQGAPGAWTHFNILVDNVVRNSLQATVTGPANITTMTVARRLSLFYADDGALGSRDRLWLQDALTILASMFRRIGLVTNASKTQTMNCFPGHIKGALSDESYLS